jgi:transposase
MRTVYAGIDVGSRFSHVAAVGERGEVLFNKPFATCEATIRKTLKEMSQHRKVCLAVEESALGAWIARVARQEVDRVIVCDPRQNRWISNATSKNDKVDALKLAQLLRTGLLKEVYHPLDEDRAVFKVAVAHYHDVTGEARRLKQKIKAHFLAYGLFVKGQGLFSEQGREVWAERLPDAAIRAMVEQLFQMLDRTAKVRKQAKALMVALGSTYPEIERFCRMPGIKEVVSCTFSGYVQDPGRFRTIRTLWKYCDLAVVHRTSCGKLVGREHLNKDGNSILKYVLGVAFNKAVGLCKEDNSFKRYYEESLKRTGSKTHARLNTQRRIALVLWQMWRKGENSGPLFSDYEPLPPSYNGYGCIISGGAEVSR